jgi:hypothetical protein
MIKRKSAMIDNAIRMKRISEVIDGGRIRNTKLIKKTIGTAEGHPYGPYAATWPMTN